MRPGTHKALQIYIKSRHHPEGDGKILHKYDQPTYPTQMKSSVKDLQPNLPIQPMSSSLWPDSYSAENVHNYHFVPLIPENIVNGTWLKMCVNRIAFTSFLLSDSVFIYIYIFLSCLHSRYSLRGHGVCSLVSRETSLELRSELWSDALLVTIIDFSGI